jgi:phosphoserine phosphatase RsbU/P
MTPADDLGAAMLGAIFLAIGLVALSLWAAGLSGRERTALWFGLLVALYGVRLGLESGSVRALGGISRLTWAYLEGSITYVILVPATQFVRALFGPGWRSSLTRVSQVAMAAAPIAMAIDVATRPGAAMWINTLLVPSFFLVLLGHLLVLDPRSWPRDLQVLAIGGSIFGLVAMFETMSGGGVIPLRSPVDLEPFAMLVFVGCLGYVVASRTIASERRLTAISRELELARQIQRSLLPRAVPASEHLRPATAYVPMTEVAGDFYDFAPRPHGGMTALVADVSGHGVPAALVASMVKVLFAAEAARADSPGAVLEAMNGALAETLEGPYVTACCVEFAPGMGRLHYACAGHPAGLVVRADGRIEPLEARGLAMGFVAGAAYETESVNFDVGDRLLLVTDGLLEAQNPAGAFFGDHRFDAVLAEARHLDAHALVARLLDEHRAWSAGLATQDDVTVLVVEARPAPAQGAA